MQEYLQLVEHVLNHGTRTKNRTGHDTLSVFGYHYEVDISDRFPLLTTKDMSGAPWNSLIHELCWYLSGQSHIRELREETSIWDDWADSNGRLETAYGRFWRRFPVPDIPDQMPGETWPLDDPSAMRKYVKREESQTRPGEEILVFDQIAYLVDLLLEKPESRRMVLTAWHPANASMSTLPPCHYTACFNATDGVLSCHLTQRSGDVGLGVPFNLASYSALTKLIAKAVGMQAGTFSHTIVDAHIYCGSGDEDDPHNHVPQLREQLDREPYPSPRLEIEGRIREGQELKFINSIKPSNFVVSGYRCHPRINLEVAV